MHPQDAFDVIVIGAGPARENVAGIGVQADLGVAVVEAQLVGGECSYWGCIPSKVLIRPRDVLAAARRVPGAASAVCGCAVPSFPTVSEVWLRLLETYQRSGTVTHGVNDQDKVTDSRIG
jgi:pyruvate/2-oxoglutarate dehydrogenase complex dihydrolipoamide dehydrogenase (E3) component